MPTQFDSFKFLGLYPSCPLPEYAVGWDSGAVYSSSLSDINVGVPLFWLLKKIKIRIEWDYTITVGVLSFTSSGSEELETDSGFFALPPHERLCIDPATDGATSDSGDGLYGYFYPFGENNLYFVAYDLREEFFSPTSSGIAFLVSSYEHSKLDEETDRYEWEEVSIPENPYNIEGTLYVGVYIIQQLGQTVSGTWNITIEEMEFWT